MSRVISFKSLRKTVSVAGTQEPLSATPVFTSFVRIRAIPGQGGTVYWGGSDIDNQGDPLAAGEFIDLPAPILSNLQEEYDLSKIYIDASANGNGVIVTYAFPVEL